MNKETREALEGSITKWKQIANGSLEDRGPSNCPLCKLFFFSDLNCNGCPVREKTERTRCAETPYEAWDVLSKFYKTRKANRPVLKTLAMEEVEFLKSLRDPEFNWMHFRNFPFEYIKVEGADRIKLEPSLVDAAEVPNYLYPSVNLKMLKELFELLYEKTVENK